MSEISFRRALAEWGRPLFFDGAQGTMLQASGMPTGACPERFCLERPDVLRKIYDDYLAAGADVVTTCTFGGTRFKLPPDLDAFDVARRAARAARAAADAAGRRVFVAGDVGPSGHFAIPLGDVEPEDLIAAFAEQIRGLAEGGADLILVETQFDLAEARAAVVAARRVRPDLPVAVSMTFEQGVSLTGSTPAIFAETMQNLGVDVVGVNCGQGPDLMEPVLRELLEACACPVLAQPNAGLPELRDGATVFPLGPEEFAQRTAAFAGMGARLLGGCCGTTPNHIAALRRAAEGVEVRTRPAPESGIRLTSRSELVHIGAGRPFVIIGERINPTGKKVLAQELQEGRFDEAMKFADQQVAAGSRVLDVNVGAPMVDETKILPELTRRLVERMTAPLALDSPNAAAVAAALPYCPGSCLVNSISGEDGRMETLGPLCRDYGAPFLLLPLRGGSRLPVTAAERIAIVEELLEKADSMGIPRRLIMVDILALSVSSNPGGAAACLDLLRWCVRHDLPTSLGISNLSFGLPARDLINSTFLSMGVGAGLTACIANPSAPRLHEAFDALNVLRMHDPHAENFVASYAEWKHAGGGAAPAARAAAKASGTPEEAVLNGDREHVVALVEKELDAGADPFAIVNDRLIPAITEVGARYERKEIFLPQLIRSAETMQTAFARLKPLLEERKGTERRPAVVMATVEGDIHDIGKNIAALLLGNHGFDVVDAGKDVSAEKIVDCAVEHGARVVGLSALMTTTMVRMEETIGLIRRRGLDIKVMVGGAAVTKGFADAIGADAYCADAVEGVRAAKRLVGAAE